jgi:hypothetical protein
MRKQGAIGLSINMIVIVLISLVVLGFGVSFLFKLIGGAEDFQGQISQQTSDRIQQLLIDEGKIVALPLHNANLYKGDSHIFGLGILNTQEDNNEFRISISAEDKNPSTNSLDWVLYDEEWIIIQQHAHHTEAISVEVPKDAKSGTYIFNAKVIGKVHGQYGNRQKFTVVVK